MLALVNYDDGTFEGVNYVCKSVKRAYELVKEEIKNLPDDEFDEYYDEEDFDGDGQREYMLEELEESYRESGGKSFSVCNYCSCEEVAEWD